MTSFKPDDLFPLPSRIEMSGGAAMETPADFKLVNHAGEGCAEGFCRGYSLNSQSPVMLPQIGVTGTPVALVHTSGIKGDAYRLSILTDDIRVEASTPAGFQYAGTTFGQILHHNPAIIPGMTIEDIPAFQHRGYMLDISRNKVPTMDTLFELVDTMARWKLNHLQLYTEHTFAYSRHPDIWRGASPMTGEEIIRLDDYCKMLNIELTANQNSFGHLHRWLKHPQYRHLAESPDGYTTPWGETRKGPFSLNPLAPDSITFLEGLYDELLPHFTSKFFNVGCDETFDLGQGFSKSACEANGKGRVYLDFLKKIKKLVDARGKTMMFWGDIMLHYPELIDQLDQDMIALVWGYEADHPFDDQCKKFAASGMPYWVCPGTSNWNSIAGRLDNAYANIDAAARAGHVNGASGFMLTEWGDNGHWQTQPFASFLLAIGAAAAWQGAAPKLSVFSPLLDHTEIIIGLGRAYQHAGFEMANTSPLFPLIRFQDIDATLAKWTLETLADTGIYLRDVTDRIPGKAGTGSREQIWRDELTLASLMLQHAIARGLWVKAGKPSGDARQLSDQIVSIREELERLWLLSNRSGGLSESIEPLVMREQEYRAATTSCDK